MVADGTLWCTSWSLQRWIETTAFLLFVLGLKIMGTKYDLIISMMQHEILETLHHHLIRKQYEPLNIFHARRASVAAISSNSTDTKRSCP